MEKLDQYTVLPALNDVDEPGDVPPQISVIIPAINEEDYIQSLVKAAQNGFYTETIVADAEAATTHGKLRLRQVPRCSKAALAERCR